MKRISWKSAIIVLLTTLFSIFFSGSIDSQDSKYSNADLIKYIEMANTSPNLNQNVIKPFVYRIAAPWIAGLLPFSISTNFLVLNCFALYALAMSMFVFLIEFGIDAKLALVMTIIFQMNKYAYQFLSWNHFHLSDSISLALLFYSFILIRKKNYLVLFIFMFFGMFVKEYMLMIIPAGFILIYLRNSDYSNLLKFGFISVLSLLVFILLRIMIPSKGGESLITQYTTQVVYYSNPILLVKRFLIPFTPFGMLPIIFYKDLFEFFRNYKYFLIYSLTIIMLSFFGEPERLMIPLSPVYYLFLTILIKKYILDFSIDQYMNKSIILILIVTFISMFYHLWGVITLPNQIYTISFTAISTLVMSLIFYYLRFKKKISSSNDLV